MKKTHLLALLVALTLGVSACGKKEEPKVEAPPTTTSPAPAAPAPTQPPAAEGIGVGTVMVGNAIGADKKITHATETLAKKDTIYVSIDTTGTGTAKLGAKWTFKKDGGDILVKEDSQTIAPTGMATSEFHISKPDGWPAGTYQVELFLDDKSVAQKSFTVK